MRFTIDREQLLKGLNLVSKAVPPKAELPVLQNIKLSLTEKGLEILGSDNNITIRTIVPYMIGEKEIIRNAENGETLVGAKILVEVVRHLEEEYVAFELIDNVILKIEDSKSNFKLNSGVLLAAVHLSAGDGLCVPVDGRDLRAYADVEVEAVAEGGGRLQEQHVPLGDGVADIVGEAAVRVRYIAAFFDQDDFGLLVHTAETCGCGGASGHTANDDILHDYIF